MASGDEGDAAGWMSVDVGVDVSGSIRRRFVGDLRAIRVLFGRFGFYGMSPVQAPALGEGDSAVPTYPLYNIKSGKWSELVPTLAASIKQLLEFYHALRNTPFATRPS